MQRRRSRLRHVRKIDFLNNISISRGQQDFSLAAKRLDHIELHVSAAAKNEKESAEFIREPRTLGNRMRSLARYAFCARPSRDRSARPIEKRRIRSKRHHKTLGPFERMKVAFAFLKHEARHVEKRIAHENKDL